MTHYEDLDMSVDFILSCSDSNGQEQAEGNLNHVRDLLEFCSFDSGQIQKQLNHCVNLIEYRKELPSWKLGFIFQLMEALCLNNGSAAPNIERMVNCWIHYPKTTRTHLVGYTLMLMPYSAKRSYIPVAMSYLYHEDEWLRNAATQALKYLK